MKLYSGHLWTHQTSALIRNVLFPDLLYIVCLVCPKMQGYPQFRGSRRESWFCYRLLVHQLYSLES